jgi:hypothetical protein
MVWILCEFKNAMKMTVFWDMAPWSLVQVDWRFRDAYYLHHHGDEMIIVAARVSQNSVHICRSTQRYIPESCHLHTRRRENLKSNWFRFCIHLRSLNIRHFRMIEETGLKIRRRGHLQWHEFPAEFNENLRTDSKVGTHRWHGNPISLTSLFKGN